MNTKRVYKFTLEESDSNGTPYFLVKSRICEEDERFTIAQELFPECDMEDVKIEEYSDLEVCLDG